MNRLLIQLLLPALALSTLSVARDLDGRLQLYFEEGPADENSETLVTFRVTEVQTYHSGDTTGDFYYIFKAVVIQSNSNEFKEKEIITAYFQKERLGRKFPGPEKINTNDMITISVKEIRGETIICMLVKTIQSNKTVEDNAGQQPPASQANPRRASP